MPQKQKSKSAAMPGARPTQEDTIVAREQHDYIPPEAPTFAARIRRAWASSLLSLRRSGGNVAVAVVFAFPGLLVLAAVMVPLLWCVHRYKHLTNRTASGEPPPGPTTPSQTNG